MALISVQEQQDSVHIYSIGKKDSDPHSIGTMAMGSIRESKTYLENTASVMSWQYDF